MPSTAPHPTTLANTHTLVLGGTSGIGFGVASAALAYAGPNPTSTVFVASSSPARVTDAIARLRTFYPGSADQIGGTAADLADGATLEATLERVLTEAVAHAGAPLNHIVITAGRPSGSALSEVTVAKAHEATTMRVLVPMLVGKLLAAQPGRFLAVDARSSVTFTGGVLGKRPGATPVPGQAPAMAWLSALEGLVRALALSLAPVRANLITAGLVETELVDKLTAAHPGAVDGFRGLSLTKRGGTVEETAEAYLFVMKCGFFTGQELIVDGGLVIN